MTGSVALVSTLDDRAASGSPNVIVADDLGSERDKTDAIIASLEAEIVTHASIMVTLGDFERASAAVRDAELDDRIGVHLALTGGCPLTDGMRRSERFCDADGRYREALGGRIAYLASAERDAVERELRTQLQRVVESGIRPAHIDSHQHVHIQPAVAWIVIRLAREFHVPRVRLAPNFRSRPGRTYRAYTALHNRTLRRLGLAGTQYVASLPQLKAPRTGVDISSARFEVVVHPILDTRGRVVDQELPDDSLVDSLASCFGGRGVAV